MRHRYDAIQNTKPKSVIMYWLGFFVVLIIIDVLKS